MSEASLRTLAWREKKRQDEFMPVTIWIPAKAKNAMTNLAFSRHQDLGELIVEAFQAWAPAQGGKALHFTSPREVEALVDRKIREAQLSQGAPAQVPAPSGPPDLPTPATGMRWCKLGLHQYPIGKDFCPQCANLRKQRSRAKLAADKRGVVPAP
jgi:hypothetical protein